MNYRVGSSLLVGMIVAILSSMYFRYIILDNQFNFLKVYVKWIPAGILFVASVILGFFSLHRKKYLHTRHYIFLVCFYLFCIIGDIMISLDGYYLIGMLSFMISYILLGSIHAKYYYQKLNDINTKTMVIGCYVIFMICMSVVVFIIKTDSQNYNKFNSTFSIIGILVYTKVIATTNIQMLTYCLTSSNTHWIMRWNFNLESVVLCIATSLFSISDCLVIYNDILYRSIYLEIAELALYWVSIYLIFLGIAIHKVPKNVTTDESITDDKSLVITLDIDQ